MLSRSQWKSGILLLVLAACADQPTQPQQTLVSRLESTRYPLDAEHYDVIDLGSFNGAVTIALAIDKHGTTFGRYGVMSAQRSFRWTRKNGFEDLRDFNGAPFQILNANDHGLLNGSVSAGPAAQRPVAWLPHSGFVYLDGDNFGTTLGNNDRGAVAGTRFLTSGSRAFIWTEEGGATLIPLEISDGTILSSGSADINENSVVVGTLSFRPTPTTPIENRAFVWDAVNGTRLIPPLGPANVGATFISDEGIAIGASETRRPLPGERRANPLASNPGDVPVHAWKWSEATGLVDLGTLGGKHSVPWNVDQDGNVYGWASDASGVQHAVKWTLNGVIVDLGTLGGNALTGGLNKHGVVAGWSVTPTGETHAVQFVPKKK